MQVTNIVNKNLSILAFVAAFLGPLGFSASKDVSGFDEEKAQKLCQEGDQGACFGLAEHFERTGKIEKAMPLYEGVCEKQIEDACIRLGNYFDEKAGQEKLTLKWYRRACQIEKSTGQGCYEMARIAKRYNSKTNVQHWLQRSCAKGYKLACP